jgi:hypothetical protein
MSQLSAPQPRDSLRRQRGPATYGDQHDVCGHAVELGCTGRPNDSKGVDMVRYHHRIAAPVVALGLALAAAGPASARFDPNPAPIATSSSSPNTSLCSEVCSASGYTAGSQSGATLPHDPRTRSAALAAGPTQPRPTATVVRVVPPKDGFDWGDAGIGAGGAIVLVMLVGAGALGVTAARRRTTSSTA